MGKGRLERIAEEIKRCRKCSLYKTRTRAVPGEGPSNASIMLIGESPGRSEDFAGRPFVGGAGKILDNALRKEGIDRKKVFITSILKCRAEKPSWKAIEACKPYTLRQIEAIKPRVIVLLGNYSMQALLGRHLRMAKMHGKNIKRGKTAYIPAFHPAAAMRFPKKIKPLFEKDLRKAR